MADSVTTLTAALAAVDAQIATLALVPPIDYSLDGQSEQLASVLGNLLKYREQLVAAIIQAEGPTEVRSQGWT